MADMIMITVLAITAFMVIRGRLRRIGKGCCSGGCAGCSGCSEALPASPGRKKEHG